MPLFACDRDLVALEPGLPRRAVWLGQRLASGTCSVAPRDGVEAAVLEASSATLGFGEAGVDDGCVVTVAGRAVEVVRRLSGTELVVCAPRGAPADPPLPPEPIAEAPFEIPTWRPQIAITETQVLRMLGLDPADPDAADAVLEPWNLRPLVCYGALHLIHAELERTGAAEPGEAERYRRLWMHARATLTVALDHDADGCADTHRPLTITAFKRV